MDLFFLLSVVFGFEHSLFKFVETVSISALINHQISHRKSRRHLIGRVVEGAARLAVAGVDVGDEDVADGRFVAVVVEGGVGWALR